MSASASNLGGGPGGSPRYRRRGGRAGQRRPNGSTQRPHWSEQWHQIGRAVPRHFTATEFRGFSIRGPDHRNSNLVWARGNPQPLSYAEWKRCPAIVSPAIEFRRIRNIDGPDDSILSSFPKDRKLRCSYLPTIRGDSFESQSFHPCRSSRVPSLRLRDDE